MAIVGGIVAFIIACIAMAVGGVMAAIGIGFMAITGICLLAWLVPAPANYVLLAIITFFFMMLIGRSSR